VFHYGGEGTNGKRAGPRKRKGGESHGKAQGDLQGEVLKFPLQGFSVKDAGGEGKPLQARAGPKESCRKLGGEVNGGGVRPRSPLEPAEKIVGRGKSRPVSADKKKNKKKKPNKQHKRRQNRDSALNGDRPCMMMKRQGGVAS